MKLYWYKNKTKQFIKVELILKILRQIPLFRGGKAGLSGV